MNWAAILFLVPYVISLSISTAVGVLAWHHRSQVGARAYAVVALSQALWTLGYIFELLSPDLSGKVFWDNFQYIGVAGWAVGFLVFTCEYTHVRVPRPRLTYSLLVLPVIAFVPLAYTDPWYHLTRSNIALILGEPFSALTYDFTVTQIALALYGYSLFLGCLIWLGVKYMRAHVLYRTQMGLVMLGNAIPLMGTLLTLVGVTTGPYRDTTPFTFAVGNLIVAWGLFRYHLFDVVPIARDTLVENMTDVVFVLDTANRLVDFNPAARAAIGAGQAGFIGQPAERVFAPWPDILTRYLNVEQAHAEIAVDNGPSRVYLDLRIQGVRDRRGRLIGRLLTAQDVTARHLAEVELKARTLQLEAANEQLQILSRAKDEFVSNVSHELRTPITNLKLHLGLLAARPERGTAILHTLQRETDRLEQMIESLLLLSRLDQNQAPLNFQPFDLNLLVDEYVTDRLPLATHKDLQLSFATGGNVPRVSGDRSMMGLVLSILLTNAINYTPPQGYIVVATQPETDGSWVGFSVADTGPGVASEEQVHLFTRFYRGRAGRASEIAGTGLGLALAKEIIDRHHGRITLESEGVPGQGATFQVWLPAKPAA